MKKQGSIKLDFREVSKEKEVKSIYEYTLDAFSESPDFNWSFDEIKREMSDGWELYGAYLRDEVVAAIFLKARGKNLLTKNTAIKTSRQGSGHSHEIKNFFEKMAKDRGLKHIFHYCGIDNFRMYSLNERHKYKKTTKTLNDGKLVEWVKKV